MQARRAAPRHRRSSCPGQVPTHWFISTPYSRFSHSPISAPISCSYRHRRNGSVLISPPTTLAAAGRCPVSHDIADHDRGGGVDGREDIRDGALEENGDPNSASDPDRGTSSPLSARPSSPRFPGWTPLLPLSNPVRLTVLLFRLLPAPPNPPDFLRINEPSPSTVPESGLVGVPG